MVRMWKDFWASRKLIWKLARNDFKTRYAGSYFGVLWAMVQPVIIVLVYWFVFQIGLNNATAELKQGISVPFVLWLVSGIVLPEFVKFLSAILCRIPAFKYRMIFCRTFRFCKCLICR